MPKWHLTHDSWLTWGKSLPRSLLKVEYWDRYHCDWKFIVDTGVSATPWFILTLITSHFFFDRPVLIVITVSRLKIVASLIAQITVQCPLVVIQLLGNFEIPKLHCYLCKKEFSITLLPVKTDSYLYFTVSPVEAMELVLQCDLFQLNQYAAVLQSTL